MTSHTSREGKPGATKVPAHRRFATDSLRRILFLDKDAGLKMASEAMALARYRMGPGPVFVKRVTMRELDQIRQKPHEAPPPTAWVLAQKDLGFEAVGAEVEALFAPAEAK